VSDVTQDSTTQPPPDPSGLRAGLDWVGKHWPRVRLGHEGVMLARVQRVQRIGELIAKNAITGKVDNTDGWPDGEGNEMGVDIGDEIHNHYYPAAPEPEKPAKASGIVGTLAKAALAAALLGSGAGVGVGVPWLLGMFKQEQPAAVPVEFEDTTARVVIE